MYATAREWRCPGLSPSREKLPEKETKYRIMVGFVGDLREGKAGTQRLGGTRTRRNPQGITENWF